MDLNWAPIKRGLSSYLVEKSESADGLSDWTYAASVTKSKASVKGLTTGQRYWFRVAGVGSAGQGPWSDIANKVAP